MPEEQRSAAEVIAEDDEAFRLTARPLQSVTIRNFKILREVDLTFPEPGGDHAPWLVLLGENASGKSTLLQAIALALAGAAEASRLTRPNRVLTRKAPIGQIRISFWDSSVPVELNFQRGAVRFSGTERPSAIVLGFGALRHPQSRARLRPSSGPRFARIGPLMAPVSLVPHPGRWLAELDEDRFNVAARVLKAILPVQEEAVMSRPSGRPVFRVGGQHLPLRLLSAGYQTVVGLAMEIMKLLFERWDTLTSATAIVLVDEIDAHLHPRWKMRIVGAMREAFPYVQFVASTHDPLVLRGLKNGEVALMRRDRGRGAVADRNLPPIEGMQVDELLTSRHFGLDSTLDPATEALFNEYYHLLSVPPTAGVADRISELRGRIADRESLGRNQRENLMLDAAQAYLAEVGDAPVPQAEQLRDETVAKLRQMFHAFPRAGANREGSR